MDSLTTAQLLRDSQQFYGESFQYLLSVFGVFIAIILAWRWFDYKILHEKIRKVAEDESVKIKAEMLSSLDDFKVYVQIALAITKYRDGKPTKEDLTILTGHNCEKMSEETICALVYAIRYCIKYVDDIDEYLAKRIYYFVLPLSQKLNSNNKNPIYGSLANQILMRVQKIMKEPFN